MDSPATTFRQSLRLLGTRRFGTFWFASLLSNLGTWAQQLAQPWLLLSLGASPWWLGLDAFALGAPVMALTLLGGVLADRADRRRVIAWLQSVQMLCPTLLVVLLWSGSVRPWIVIVLSLVIGITDALSMPSFQTIVASIVSRRDLPNGIALNATQFNVSRIAGPALAGILMATVGAAGAFAVSAASYVPFIVVALWILPHAVARPPRPPGAARARPLAGVREVMQHPDLRSALLITLVNSVLCAPLLTFCAVLVREDFRGGIGHFSLAMSAFGVGGLLGALGLLALDPTRDRRALSCALAIGYAVVVVLSAVNPWAWALPVLFVAAGVSMTASNASVNTHLQARAPEALRGQTISLYMLTVRGGAALGGLLTGAVVGVAGVRHALLLDGALAVLAQLAVRRRWLRTPVDPVVR